MTETRRFGRHLFQLIEVVRLDLSDDGTTLEYVPQLPPTVRRNRHAEGPFCRLSLPGAASASGVYAITVDDELKYVGECEDLGVRFGPTGYGEITARNCHSDGQSTNCKINARILLAVKSGGLVRVWFLESHDRKKVEAEMVDSLGPPWNSSRRDSGGARSTPVPLALPPTANVFRLALDAEFEAATALGRLSVRVRAGDLHLKISSYSGGNNRMPVCCRVMRAAMRAGDTVVASPPKGAGPNLVIEYLLPRG